MKLRLVTESALLVLFVSSVASATPSAHDPDAIDQTAKAAYTEGKYTFCTDPSRPLGHRAETLCPIAAELPDCEGFLKACNLKEPTERSWFERLIEVLRPIAHLLLYALVIAIVVVVAIPVIRALAKLRRDRKIQDRSVETENRAVVQVPEPTTRDRIDDAESALRLADEHRARGELSKALGLYLAAALSALDRRGAIRLARHRTNGEYVRTCAEEANRTPLRELVREVDKVEFGGTQPTTDGVDSAGARARSIVRIAATTALLVLASCSALHKPSADPASDDLPKKVLERNGFKVGALGSSLATMPIPEGEERTPVVIVDVEKVPLEDEARAHMLRWVEAGGALVLFGNVRDWPSELRAKVEPAETRDLVVRTSDPNGGLQDIDADEEDPAKVGAPIEITGARTARRSAFAWKTEAETIGRLGDAIYASKLRVGKGIVLGVANDDLFTNVGMLPPRNAAALVTMLRSATHDPARWRSAADAIADIRVAHAEAGIPPADNPFAALIAAGLAKGVWHLLAAAIVLFLAYGIRHARPRSPDKLARRAFTEHVEATGTFYGKTRSHTHALSAYGRFVELRLREHLPRGADPASFLATRAGADAAHVSELYTRATQAKASDPPRGDELTIIEELRRLMEKAVSNQRSGLARKES